MPSMPVAAWSGVLTTSGTAAGYATFSGGNTGVYPGAKGWLSDADATPRRVRVMVTNLSGTTLVGLRIIPENLSDNVSFPIYHRSDISAYTTAHAARLDLEAQVVQVNQPLFDPRPGSEI